MSVAKIWIVWRVLEPLCMFAEQHRDRIGFLARRAARHPDANLVVLLLAREELRNVRLERGETHRDRERNASRR